jgi:hypothetical protein
MFALQVNYINAHATSSRAGDLAEVKALKQVFKDTSQIKMNATKVMGAVHFAKPFAGLQRDCLYAFRLNFGTSLQNSHG